MYDLMTGADTKEEKFGFILRKWLSNEKEILEEITDVSTNKIGQIKEREGVKTLGVQWKPEADNFICST